MRNQRDRAKRVAGFAVLVVLALVWGGPFTLEMAYALPMLELSSGESTVTIADGGVGDWNPLAGAITYGGSVGSFFLNVTTGLSKPLLGSANYPSLDLNSVNVSTWTGGTLTIKLTDTDFSNSSGNPFLIGSAIGGVTAGNISYQSYFDASNTPFGTASLLGSLGPYSGPFSGSSFDNVTAAGPYSLTLITTITHTGGGSLFPQASSFNATLRVPEPGTAMLLGATLIGIGISTLRTHRRQRVS